MFDMFSMTLSRKMIFWSGIAVFAGLIIYTVLFAQLPAAHDTFHELRHSLGVSCH